MLRLISRKLVTVVLAPAAIALGAAFTANSASAVVYDAAADFDTAYTAGNNPNGTWTYGWSSTLSSALTVYQNHSTYDGLPSAFEFWYDPTEWFNDPDNPSQTPFAAKNTGPAYADTMLDIPAGALILHGGGASHHDYSHVLWTAPNDGTYSIECHLHGTPDPRDRGPKHGGQRPRSMQREHSGRSRHPR